ncbi:unnamed protein product [Lactuca saligna]|uniref:MULE transposase domain-containing protein n=1 Tax=Lactuca saligna TaxID=75948 RepID=A0AA36EGP9_LACSI|nr:unnamed protein product [Lactuca saligna]
MDDIHDFDTIDVELDAYFKKKQASRCKDEFINILCEEHDYEVVDDAQTGNDAQTGITKEESDENYLEGSNEEGSDEEFEYSTHNPKVKWNKMRPMLGESVRLVAICGSDTEKCPFVVRASWMSTERSRMRALSLIHGNLSDHYARVWDYGHELLRSNPDSIIRITVTVNPDNTTTFHRFYICFKAIREGWKRACRRVYPIAWAVVDVENKNNWQWFLDLVNDDLGLQGGKGVCVISDQHKGLVEASKDILPYVEHRQCARHIYANFRKVYSGVQFRNMFWAAAKSTTEGDFNFNMERIRAISYAAYDHLMAREPTSWCRAYFSTAWLVRL